MKKILLVAVLFLLTHSNLSAQNRMQVANLSTLAKVWGFLKYYHPEAAKGNPDWDRELIRMIPLAKSAVTKNAFNQLMTQWYQTLPKARLANQITQPTGDSILRVFDENDISKFDVPPGLKKELTKLYFLHLPDSSKYITDHVNQYTLDYTKHIEEPFATPAFPDEPHRLLGLFRYWNVINFFYPHKQINAVGWNEVLPEFIGKFINCTDSNSYRYTFLQLTAKLKDSHSFFNQAVWDRLYRTMIVPFSITYINGRFYIGGSRYDSLMKSMDLRIGDEIIAVNGKPLKERINELKSRITGTNELSFYRNVGGALFSMDTSHLRQMKINRQGKIMDKTFSVFPWSELSKFNRDSRPLWENLGNDIWLVRFCEIKKIDTLKKLMNDIHDATTVIWDMRGYPDFFVSQAVKRGIFAENPLCQTTANSMVKFPGSFIKHTWPVYDENAPDTLHLPLYKGRMIVLVNEFTQSLSESCAFEYSFRKNTIVMGRQTAGTTGNVTWVDYPGGIGASFTAVWTYGLNDRFIEGPGVKLDKEIKLIPEDLIQSPDFILETAYKEALKDKW